jgi:hypothetical protein
VDGLTALDFGDESQGRATLKILNDAGQWMEVPPPTLEIAPAVDLRKQAVQVIKRAGFKYILFSTLDWNRAAFIDVAADWGLTPVAGTPRYTLFRIE